MTTGWAREVKDDAAALELMGYEQKLDRGFSRLSLLGMGFCILK